MVDIKSENGDGPVSSYKKTCGFSRNILKQVVGQEKADNALRSFTMSVIPQADQKGFSFDLIQKAQSIGDMGSIISNRLELLNGILEGKKKKDVDKKESKQGIDKYFVEGSGSSDSDDLFEKDDISGGFMCKEVDDPSKLIDLELIKLLQYCHKLLDFKSDESYEDELMLKSFQIGKEKKSKLLIFDMDETLVAAKFEGRIPKGFEPTFSFGFKGCEIQVRMRPYVIDCLEKLAHLYEIIVFTAGEQEYADHILDYIDPEKKIFTKRLYRQDCIKVTNFFVKDLDIILDRKKENIIIVDNSIVSFAFDLDNGVPINSFIGNEEDDKELLFLYSFLEEAASSPDVRKNIQDAFRLSYLQSTVLKK